MILISRRSVCILLLLCIVLAVAVESAQLQFKFVAAHDETPADIAAEGTAMFLSALTGLDFTRWETKVIESTKLTSKFDILADVPNSDKERIDKDVREYVSTGAINDDFALHAYGDIRVSLRDSSGKANFPTLEKPVEKDTKNPPKKQEKPEKPSPSASPSKIVKKKETEKIPSPSLVSPAPSVAPVKVAENNSANEDKVFSKATPKATPEMVESAISTPEAEFSREISFAEEEQPEQSSIPLISNPGTEETSINVMDEELKMELEQRNITLSDGQVLSDALLLNAESPVYGFPSELGDAFKWFLSVATDTDVDNHVVWDTITTSPSTFVVSLKVIGNPSELEETIDVAKEFVSNGGLTEKLNDLDPEGQFVVSLFEGDIEQVKAEQATEIMPQVSYEPLLAIASPDPALELQDDEDVLLLPLNVSSPVIGFNNELKTEIAQFSADNNEMQVEDWALRRVTSTEDHGHFDVQYEIRVEKESKKEVADSLMEFMRERKLDEHLESTGFAEVEVRLMPRLLNSSLDMADTENRGSLKPSTGTIVASVVGIALVIAMGIIVAICCLPRKNRPS